jgi:predicted ribosome quality control (RQC) complex YloA/Tae2 family protein
MQSADGRGGSFTKRVLFMSGMPSNIKEIYEKLKEEIIWLHGRWTLFTQLFAKSDKRINLLNECASSFFHAIEGVRVGDVMLSLCKITDPANTRTRAGNFDNMSLKQLQQRLEAEEPQLTHRLQNLLNKLDDKCKDFREWRNKSLAHSGLATASGAYLLPETPKKW